MIQGSFGAAGRPYLRVRIRLTRFDREIDASFLVDTGADSTSISTRDWRRLGLTRRDIGRPSETITGYGGSIEVATESAELAIEHDNGSVDRVMLDVEVAPEEASGLPSILGRDVLAGYRLVYSPIERMLTIERVHGA